jgi:hypothetical protein
MVDENQTAPIQRVVAPRFLSWGIVAILFVGSPASAADEFPHEGDRGMPSVLRVGVPVPAPGKVAVAAGAGYGFIDPALDLENPASRLRGSVGISAAVLPFLLIGADARGHMDLFSEADDDDPNLYGEPRLTARLQMPASKSLYWGAQLDARFLGEKAPDVDFSATSPSVRGLLGARLASRTWLGAELGFHLDNSAKTLPSPEFVSSADRVTVGASSSPGIPWGVGVSHRLGFGLELLGELRGEVLVGGDAPSFFESPLGLGFGARQPLTDYLDAMLSTDVSLSARPDFNPDAFEPIEPRAGVMLTAIFRFGVEKDEPVEPKPAVKPKEPEKKVEEAPKEPVVPMFPVQGMVVDEGGRPLPDVTITLTREGADPIEERSYTDGRFEFKDVPEGAVELSFKTPGYDEIKVSIAQGEERKKEVVLYPSLPAGQVKGEVRDLKGNPLAANITITPGDKVIQVSEDGTFELELAPGSYTVHFEHPELAPQKRFIRVQDRGVVILNIALTP